jgi:hypothetical protein
MAKFNIAWNEDKTIGVVCADSQMAYELRKGSNNPLGIVTYDFCEAWANMTATDNCTIQEVELELNAGNKG